MHRTMTTATLESRPQWMLRVAGPLVAIAASLLLTPAAFATCGSNQISVIIQVPKPATPDVLINKQVCKTCPSGQAPNKTHTQCVAAAPKCASGVLNPLSKACEPKCAPGYGINDFSNTCQKCAAGTRSHPISSNFPDQDCTVCNSGEVPNAQQSGCKKCPPGTVPYSSTGGAPTQCVSANKKKTTERPLGSPGLLESTPGLGTQGPAATGNPLGGGAPKGGATRSGGAGIR